MANRFQSRNPVRALGMSFSILLVLAWVGSLSAGDSVPGPKGELPKVFSKDAPENLEDLLAIQKHVRELVKKLIPCTVGLRIGVNQGSGVIIDKEGHVLTAGHVSGQPGQNVVVILADGRQIKGKTLGANQGIDSGLVQITETGNWPFVEMGKSADLKKGQWCLAIGHPTGVKEGRPPVLRVGRVLDHGSSLIRTDCTLVGGDSGGPLFDMYGRVIGIHSRIGGPLTTNIHVPVDTYRDTWERLARGDLWGGKGPKADSGYMGVELDPDAKNCRIRDITPGSPADKAGLKANDIVLSFDGKKVKTYEELASMVQNKKVGAEVALLVQRESATLTLKLVLGKRPPS